LCAPCYRRATENFNHIYAFANLSPMDSDELRPARAAAIAALSTISTLTTTDMSLSDHYDLSSEISDEEIINFESQFNRERSVELSNNFSVLVGQSPIRDIRNRNIVCEKINDAFAIIRQATEQVYKDDEKKDKLKIDDKPELTMNDATELINTCKFLVNISDHSEKIRLFTLAPKS
ncbi:unnamed protein product, partial [Rotaria sordida]